MKQTVVENINPIEFKQIIDSYGAKDVFLVTGKASFHKSGAKVLLECLKSQGTKFHHFSEFDVNPNYDDVIKGFNLFRSKNCDLILAIGGGSVIDVAKCINVFQSHGDTNKRDLVLNNLILNKGVPLIAIPTTAGSGSEATHFAVIYLDGLKYSLAHASLLPEVAVLNSEYTLSQSNYLTACSGLDALSQAIESFWSINSTEESREYSRKSIELILPNLEKAVNKSDVISRQLVFKGAHYAGRAINIAKTTAPHAFSYYLTKKFNLPHGHAVSIFLPSFIDYNFYLNNHTKKKYEHKHDLLYDQLNKLLLSKNSSDSLTSRIKLFILSLGVQIDIYKLNISKEEIILALKSGDAQRLNNNPREFNLDDFINETSILG